MCQRKCNQKTHRGSALISAIFITAIAAMIAMAMAMQQHLLIHESSLVINADQDYFMLQGMQYEAELAVQKYAVALANIKNPSDTFVSLETQLPTIKTNKMVLSGTIDDEQGKFNLNNLANSANQSQFVALLQAVMPQISTQKAYVIAKAITTWITNNSEDSYYLTLHPSYRAPQGQMANISELQLVAGITPDIYSALESYVTALPIQASLTGVSGTPINVNSASAPVLLITNPSLTLSKAENIVACRKQHGGFIDTTTFITDCVKPEGIATMNNITTASTYFLSQAQAQYADHVITLTSLWVTQIQKDNTLKVAMVWQSFE